MTDTGNLMEEVMLTVSGEEQFSDVTAVVAYENSIKPTPLKEPIVAFSTKGCTIGPKLTTVRDTGEIVSTNNREVQTTLSMDIYMPYSKGGFYAHKLYDKLATFLMFQTKYNVIKSTCYDTEYDKSCQAIVLRSQFVFQNVASA